MASMMPLLAFFALGLSAQSVQERHFGSGWQAVSTNLPVPVSVAEQGDDEDKHSPIAHMHITRRAVEYFMSRYPDSELAAFKEIVASGAHDEDKPYQNPFNELVSVARHFWNPDGGPYAGLGGSDSAVNRAQKYFSGGYGLGNKYDPGWGKNGVQGEGAVSLHAKDKKKGYWYLGHAAHLLEDMTVPAHTHLWPHFLPNMDRYETHMKTRHDRWDAPQSGPVEAFGDLYTLFKDTALRSKAYDCGSGAAGKDGSVDRGRRRKGGFKSAELDEIAADLAPLGVRRVAALFRLYYAMVDRQPPVVTLVVKEGKLAASVKDELSGADPQSVRYWVKNPRVWNAWDELRPGADGFVAAPDGGQVRATAEDAAGNVGEALLFLR